MCRQTPIPAAPTTAVSHRYEAMSLREAAEIVRDRRLAKQLLSIADQYEAAADSIELTLGRNLQAALDLDLPEAAD